MSSSSRAQLSVARFFMSSRHDIPPNKTVRGNRRQRPQLNSELAPPVPPLYRSPRNTMHRNRLTQLINVVALACVSGCAITETVPQVVVKSNNSGIDVGAIERQGPSWLISKSWDTDGNLNPPDVPSRTIVEVKRVRSLHNKEPRYFIPASGSVQVVSIERYSDYRGTAPLGRWRSLLRSANPLCDEEQKMLNDSQMSEIPWMNAGRCFHGKLRKRCFPWGDAILFLTSYVQGKTGGPVNNDMLVLVAQGLTKDGRYAVNARFEIHHPKLPDSSWDERRQGRAVFSIDDECEQAERWLDEQPDDAFTPTIGQYEQFLSSLEISAGNPIKQGESGRGDGIAPVTPPSPPGMRVCLAIARPAVGCLAKNPFSAANRRRFRFHPAST